MTARDIRNNNPGNIVAGDHWQGLMPCARMAPAQAAEDRFAVFAAPKWGFRAMAIILLNYVLLHHLDTLRAIITRWAPPSENNTEAYIAAVCDALGVNADAPQDFTRPDLLAALCKAISIHECGGWQFAVPDLTAGVQMAEAA